MLEKGKELFFFLSLPFLIFGPLNRASPARPSLPPRRAQHRRPSSAPAQPQPSRAAFQQPPPPSFPLQRLSTRPRLSAPPPSSRNRSARQPQPPPAPTSRVMGSPSPRPGLFLSEAEPPRVPLSLSAPILLSLTLRRPPPSLGEAPPSTEIGTAVDRLPRAISDPFLPRGETPMLSSLSLSFSLAFDGLNGRFACGREALGRRPWRPPLQPSPPATFLA